MRINKNVKSVVIEGVAACGKTVLIRYLIRDLLKEFSKKDFVIIGKRLGDYNYFQGDLILLSEENELKSVLENVLNNEEKKVIILSEMSEEDIREVSQLITKNKKHLTIIEAQSLPPQEIFDLEFIGRNTPAKEKARNLDLDIKRGQFWVNDVVLFECPYTTEDYQIYKCS